MTTQWTHYTTDTTMALPEPHQKLLVHFISCERYCQLQAKDF